MRQMLRTAVERLGQLGPATFISARQECLETIHQHALVARRGWLLCGLERQLRGAGAAAADRGLGSWMNED